MYHVLFDLGNVLIDFDHRKISKQLAECAPSNQESDTLQDQIHSYVFGAGDQSSPNVHLDRGTKSIDELHIDLVREFDLSVSNEAFRETWSSIFSDDLNANTMRCLNQLRDQGLRIAICSNTNPAHWDPLVNKHAELNDLASNATCFLSYELGKQKADPGFFDQILKLTKSPPSHHLLIDDLAENCQSAEVSGMHAVLFRPDASDESIGKVHAFVDNNGWGGSNA